MSEHSIKSRLEEKRPVFSVEFFPPKTEEGARLILRTAKALQQSQPDFVSITYGAGGSTRDRTLAYGELLKDIFGYEVMPHLTCVGHTRDELKAILERFYDVGFRNIMTLRGDPPKGETEFKPHPDGLSYASELVAFIRETYPDFCLGVGGYPEKHPEAPSMEIDLKNLQRKISQGSDFITTQLFFDNSDYLRFTEQCRKLDINVPIIPGILPALNIKQVRKFCGFCGAKLPLELEQRLANAAKNEDAEEIGIDWAFQQIRGLLAADAPGVHLYILNRSSAAVALSQRLQAEGLLS